MTHSRDDDEGASISRNLVADAAHQLRTPIASIQACVETLLRGVDPDERDRLFAHLVRETARAAHLINSLIRAARLDAGEILVRRPCDLVALCADEADRTWTLAPHLDMVLRAGSVPEPAPALDAAAIREIVANLLDNARRHALRRVEVAISSSPAQVEVRIVDDGPGMTEDRAELAFGRFVSLDGMGGSGLGLPIARGLARAHGGELSYEDGGFVLRLPVVEEPPPLAGPE